ncbi:Purple acid phosphatase 10 [Sarracenia purpurea var. burkii]
MQNFWVRKFAYVCIWEWCKESQATFQYFCDCYSISNVFKRIISQERVSNIAYNIVNGICTPVGDQSAPVYITIGDGGNIEGLATNMTEPQPNYSAFREASFGHAIFDIKNRSHAYFGWHRNQDGYAVEADSLWFFNRYWLPIDDSAAT